ncbi:MAG TPA: DNA repair protein RecN, partial [Fibrobacteria bacterium]|nr:DNA repair protein RecN [Fibrobacteria bacterium]
ASNPGEPAKPLRQIASGGEISRIMLAIKGALAQTDPRPLLVFDEVDTGIGGVTANRVGQALKELATHHQLIVITHLHQVAALAGHQQRVMKELEGGRTVTRVMRLSAKERVQELARMMGDESSAATLKHARELLAQG